MDSRQQKILRSLSNISFGFVIYWLTFLATLLARLLLEGTLFGPMESDGFLPSSLTIILFDLDGDRIHRCLVRWIKNIFGIWKKKNNKKTKGEGHIVRKIIAITAPHRIGSPYGRMCSIH